MAADQHDPAVRVSQRRLDLIEQRIPAGQITTAGEFLNQREVEKLTAFFQRLPLHPALGPVSWPWTTPTARLPSRPSRWLPPPDRRWRLCLYRPL
ncbi:MAG: hypothetical protein ACLP7J_23480 [Streptosporangiaceae bacterium]